MTISKKLVELKNLLKKSEELSSKILELNNDLDKMKLSELTIHSEEISKSDLNIVNKIMKEFKQTHEKISEILSTFTVEEKEELKKLNLKI